MNRISLILDNPVRDLSYVSLIAMELAENGFEVNIVPSNMRHYELILSCPDYVLYPHQREGSSAEEILILDDQGIEIGVMETEQHIKENYFIDYQMPKNLNSLRIPKHVFSWGYYFQSLMKNNNLYSDQQIKVVGNPRYDEYIFNPETFEKSIKLLIATSFGIANPNYLSKKQNKKAFLNANMSEEDYLRYFKIHKGTIENLLDLIKEDFFELGNGLKLRPHPYENEKLYIKELSNSVVLSNEEPIVKQLKQSNSFMHYHSVSSVDSAVLQIPSINMSWLPTDYKMHDSTPFMLKTSYQPNSQEEMKELILLIKKSKLKPRLEIDDPIFEEYLFKTDGIAYKRVAEHIMSDINPSLKRNFSSKGPFNNISATEHFLKFIYHKHKWKRTKKYFSSKDIKNYIDKCQRILQNDFKFNISNNEFKNIELTSVKIVADK